MRKRMNLRLFEEGGGAPAGAPAPGATGTGGQGGNAGSGAGTPPTGNYSYEQLEEIATSRAERASRSALASFFRSQGMTEEEVTAAINDFKTKKAASQPNISQIEKERDEARKQLEQYQQKETMKEQGVAPDYMDFVLYEASKKVNDKTDFKAALEAYLKENPQYAGGGYRVAPARPAPGKPGGAAGNVTNDYVNDMIRKAARR